MITQSDKKSDKLGMVFDMILNSEYYNYAQKLYWVYLTNGLNGDPAHIDYIAAESPKQTEKTVRVAESGKIGATENNAIPEDASEKLLRSLAKYRAKVGDKNITKDVPQIKDLAILDKYKPKDCDSLFDTNGGNQIEPIQKSFNVPIGELPTPTRQGYTFIGWYTDNNFETLVTSETIVTSSTTYYARWGTNTFTITYTVTYEGQTKTISRKITVVE